MAIYSYTMKKYLKAKSTWIIIIIGFLISAVLGGVLPWSLYNASADVDGIIYSQTLIASVGGVSSMMGTFTAVFSAYKSATMYKDEVEDGTFLVMLSKPQSRLKIIMFKWLALQTVTLLFIVICMGGYVVLNMINDTVPKRMVDGIDSFSSNAGIIFVSMSSVLIIVSLIFSSFGLLISTRTSTAATIGIGTTLGVIIPITSLIALFTQTTTDVKVTSSAFELSKNSYDRLSDGSDILKTKITDLDKALTDKETGLLNLAINNNKSDSYKYWSALDLNLQMGMLSAHATDALLSDEMKDLAIVDFGGPGGNTTQYNKVASINPIGKAKTITEKEAELQKMIGSFIVEANKFGSTSLVELIALNEDFKNRYANVNDGREYDLTSEIGENDGKAQVEVNGINFALSSIKRTYQGLLGMSFVFTNVDPQDPTVPLNARLNFLLNDKTIDELAKTVYDLRQNTDEVSFIYNDGANDHDITLPQGSSDAIIYNTFVGIANKDGSALNMVESVPYISKWTVTWVYLLIAFGLIPLSIFIVQRQDFR